MRRILLALITAAVSGTSLAQSAPPIWIALTPVIPADAHTRTGFGLAGGLDVRVSRAISIGGVVGHWIGGSDFQKNSTVTCFGGMATWYWTEGQLRPFAQLGGGIYWTKFQYQSRVSHATVEERATLGGGFGGLGLERRITGQLAVRVSARYHLVSDYAGVHSDFLEGLVGVRVLP